MSASQTESLSSEGVRYENAPGRQESCVRPSRIRPLHDPTNNRILWNVHIPTKQPRTFRSIDRVKPPNVCDAIVEARTNRR